MRQLTDLINTLYVCGVLEHLAMRINATEFQSAAWPHLSEATCELLQSGSGATVEATKHDVWCVIKGFTSRWVLRQLYCNYTYSVCVCVCDRPVITQSL